MCRRLSPILQGHTARGAAGQLLLGGEELTQRQLLRVESVRSEVCVSDAVDSGFC